MTEVEKQQIKPRLGFIPLNFLEARKKAKKKAHMTKWFYAAPLGQPRRVDVSRLRELAETPWARVCIDTIVNEITSLDYNFVHKQKVKKDLRELKDEGQENVWRQKNDELQEQIDACQRFFERPNDNDESFKHILRQVVKDLLELDAGIIIKEYQDEDYVQVKKLAKKGWDWEKWDKTGESGKRDKHFIAKGSEEREFQVRSLNPAYEDYKEKRKMIKKVQEDVLKKLNPPAWSSVGQTMIDPETEKKPQLVAIKAYDGGTFLPDVDRYGYIKGWWQYTYANPGGKPIYFSEKEVVYLKQYPRTIDPYGFGPIQACEDVLEMLESALDWNKTRFDNENTVPGLVVPEETLDEDTFEQARMLLNPAGKHEKFRQMLVNMKLGFVPFTGAGQGKQMDWIQGIQYYFQIVMGEFKVTPTELGFMEGATRATAEEQSEVMRRKSTKPILDLLEYHINNEILPDLLGKDTEELEIEFKFGPAVDRYEEERKAKEGIELAREGFISLNMLYTDYLNMDALDDPRADEIKVLQKPEPPPSPFGFGGGGFGHLPPAEPVGGKEEREEGKEEKPTLPPPKALAEEGKKKEIPVSNYVSKYAIIKPEKQEEDLEKARELLEAGAKWIQSNEKALTTSEPILPRSGENVEPLILEPVTVGVDSFYKLPNPASSPDDPREINLESFEERFRKALETLFQKQQKEFVALFQKQASQEVALEKDIHDNIREALNKLFTDHKEEFKNILKEYLTEGLMLGGNKAFDELKVEATFNLEDPLAIEYLETFTEFLGNQKYDAVRDRLKTQIREGLLKGESVDTIAKRVKEEYSSLRGPEAERIARSEVNRSSNYGREAGYVKSGLVKNKQWLVTYDDRTCPFCYEMANQEVALKQNFFSAEYGHVKDPPLHPNCRCTIVPVLREEVLHMNDAYFMKTSKMKEVEGKIGELIEDYLEREYGEKELGSIPVAEALGVSDRCVVNWLKTFGIPVREKGFPWERGNIRNNTG